MPSGADVASVMQAGPRLGHRAGPRSDLPVLDRVSVRQGRGAPDGVRFVAERLAEITTLTRLGVPVAVVFDLDNTVFDTRHRTLHAAQQFDRDRGTEHFAGVTVSDMAVDGRTTAQQLGLADDVIESFGAFWDQSFWTPAHLAHDAPIGDMVELVHRARAAGAAVKFLTGRIATFHADSVAQLKKAGVDVDDGDVCCKPDLSVRTGPFKEAMLTTWSGDAALGFFVTEGVRDLLHLQGALSDLPLLRLDCSLEVLPDSPAVEKAMVRIPLWPASF